MCRPYVAGMSKKATAFSVCNSSRLVQFVVVVPCPHRPLSTIRGHDFIYEVMALERGPSFIHAPETTEWKVTRDKMLELLWNKSHRFPLRIETHITPPPPTFLRQTDIGKRLRETPYVEMQSCARHSSFAAKNFAQGPPPVQPPSNGYECTGPTSAIFCWSFWFVRALRSMHLAPLL